MGRNLLHSILGQIWFLFEIECSSLLVAHHDEAQPFNLMAASLTFLLSGRSSTWIPSQPCSTSPKLLLILVWILIYPLSHVDLYHDQFLQFAWGCCTGLVSSSDKSSVRSCCCWCCSLPFPYWYTCACCPLCLAMVASGGPQIPAFSA